MQLHENVTAKFFPTKQATGWLKNKQQKATPGPSLEDLNPLLLPGSTT